MKENADYFAEFICFQFNDAANSSKFPIFFKCTNISPIFKNESRNRKTIYRLVSILPIVPKIFEKIMSNKLSTYFEKNYSKFQCGFRKSFSTQHCLLLMLEKWKHAGDNKKVFGALLTDLSKAFGCIYHDLLIAKLNTLLQNRKRRTKHGTVCSLWEELFSGVAQRSILGHSYLKYFSAIYF